MTIVFTLGAFLAPGVLWALPSDTALNTEVDARTVPWHVVRSLALQAGKFPPLYQPISEQELAEIWPERYMNDRRGLSWQTLSCKENPVIFRVRGRTQLGYLELGDVTIGESGLGWAAGYNASFEPSFDVNSGRWYFAATARLQGRWAAGGKHFQPGEVWTYPGWHPSSSNFQVGLARTRTDRWLFDFPQFIAGCKLGDWNLTAGWMPSKTGAGVSGALDLDYNSPSFPSLVIRRNRPFQWGGFMKPLAPSNFLLRTGILSKRQVLFKDEWGIQKKNDNPWFFQWLVAWDVTSWFRTTVTHSTMASAREGTLWPDLLQINFPIIGTTWREADSGPVTDRIFSAQFEFRWQNAPWPVIPARSGRLYWQYAGTDFLPSGPAGVVPELSLPASVAGVEFFSPGWDLTFEYFGSYHPEALWYSNGGYPEGYTENEWILGHFMGGGAKGGLALVRVRPNQWDLEFGVKATYTNWQHEKYLPGEANRLIVELTCGADPQTRTQSSVWTGSLQWVHEEYFGDYAEEQKIDWIKAGLKLEY
ncbi:MAG: capsule assembly Wzi family protein [bacterium]|nr:capsule assembly Wzi family protein [bacterium]